MYNSKHNLKNKEYSEHKIFYNNVHNIFKNLWDLNSMNI